MNKIIEFLIHNYINQSHLEFSNKTMNIFNNYITGNVIQTLCSIYPKLLGIYIQI